MERQSPQPNSDPLYHDISPRKRLLTRGIGLCTLIMVLLSFIFCMVQGAHNHTFYLLACNTVISGFIGVLNAWWYRKGDLDADKFWYMILVGAVIMFQCLAINIFVFHLPSPVPTPTTPTPHNVTNTTTHKPPGLMGFASLY